MYANNYAGCGCTSLADYAGPRFVPARPQGYGTEAGISDRARYTGIGATLLVLAGMVYFFNEAEKDMLRRTPRKSIPATTVPRKYRLPR
jgi:hypothetical protein